MAYSIRKTQVQSLARTQIFSLFMQYWDTAISENVSNHLQPYHHPPTHTHTRDNETKYFHTVTILITWLHLLIEFQVARSIPKPMLCLPAFHVLINAYMYMNMQMWALDHDTLKQQHFCIAYYTYRVQYFVHDIVYTCTVSVIGQMKRAPHRRVQREKSVCLFVYIYECHNCT